MSFYGKGDTGIINAVCKLSKGVSGAWGNYQHIQKFFRTDWLCVEDGMYDLVIADFLDLSPEVFGQTKTGINGISVWGHDGNDFPVWMLRNCFQLGDDLRKGTEGTSKGKSDLNRFL